MIGRTRPTNPCDLRDFYYRQNAIHQHEDYTGPIERHRQRPEGQLLQGEDEDQQRGLRDIRVPGDVLQRIRQQPRGHEDRCAQAHGHRRAGQTLRQQGQHRHLRMPPEGRGLLLRCRARDRRQGDLLLQEDQPLEGRCVRRDRRVHPVCGYPLKYEYNKNYGLNLWICTNEPEVCDFMTNDRVHKHDIKRCPKCRDGYLIVKMNPNNGNVLDDEEVIIEMTTANYPGLFRPGNLDSEFKYVVMPMMF